MGEASFLGLTIKDPVWYLIIYPLNFALIFGGLLIAIENGFLDISESFAAVVSIVFAGIITLVLRSEAKK
jgi:hypothetical protein